MREHEDQLREDEDQMREEQSTHTVWVFTLEIKNPHLILKLRPMHVYIKLLEQVHTVILI